MSWDWQENVRGRETLHSSYNIFYVLVRRKPCLINTDIQVVLEDNLDPLVNKDVSVCVESDEEKCYKSVLQVKLLIMQLISPWYYI